MWLRGLRQQTLCLQKQLWSFWYCHGGFISALIVLSYYHFVGVEIQVIYSGGWFYHTGIAGSVKAA